MEEVLKKFKDSLTSSKPGLLLGRETMMASVHDVAAFILDKKGWMTAMKMQKLVYYCQAWSLVWDDVPLFNDPIEAWVNGPVIPELFRHHRGQFKVRSWPWGNAENLEEYERETVEAILDDDAYGGFSSQQLSDLTHREDPWRQARAGLPPGVRGNAVIEHGIMQNYYSSL